MGLHRISIQKSFKSNLANLFSNCFDFAQNAAMQNFKTIWANDENVMAEREFGILSHLLPPLDKMAAISQTTFSYAYLWMKRFVLWLKFD